MLYVVNCLKLHIRITSNRLRLKICKKNVNIISINEFVVLNFGNRFKYDLEKYVFIKKGRWIAVLHVFLKIYFDGHLRNLLNGI